MKDRTPRRMAALAAIGFALSGCGEVNATYAATPDASSRPSATAGQEAGAPVTTIRNTEAPSPQPIVVIDCRTYNQKADIQVGASEQGALVRILGDTEHGALALASPNGAQPDQIAFSTPQGFSGTTNPDRDPKEASVVVSEGAPEVDLQVDTGEHVPHVICAPIEQLQADATSQVDNFEDNGWRVDVRTVAQNGLQDTDHDKNRIYPPN